MALRILFFIGCFFTATVGLLASASLLTMDQSQLRYDLHLLAHHRVIQIPINTWPMSWDAINRELDRYTIADDTPDGVRAAIRRIRVASEHDNSVIGGSAHVSGRSYDKNFIYFEDRFRDRYQVTVGGHFNWENLYVRPRVQYGYTTAKKWDWRLDDSFLAVEGFNWIVAAGNIERYWGPANDSSLIMSNNAVPVPSVLATRRYPTPFGWDWLRWMGPWNFTTFIGQLESNRTISNGGFWGSRLTFMPLSDLEIGVSRTAQFKPGSNFLWVLFGIDNEDKLGVTTDNEPGNQLGGFDLKWRFRVNDIPTAFYFEYIGEDAGTYYVIPSMIIKTYGFESYFTDSIKGYVEFTTTLVGDVIFPRYYTGTAFSNYIFRSGYTHFGRVIGHTIEGDSFSQTVGLETRAGDFSSLYTLRYIAQDVNPGVRAARGQADTNFAKNEQVFANADFVLRLGTVEYGVSTGLEGDRLGNSFKFSAYIGGGVGLTF